MTENIIGGGGNPAAVPTTERIVLSNLQTQALVSLLCTVGTTYSIDIRQADNLGGGTIAVTVWRDGDPTVWSVQLDGATYERAEV